MKLQQNQELTKKKITMPKNSRTGRSRFRGLQNERSRRYNRRSQVTLIGVGHRSHDRNDSSLQSVDRKRLVIRKVSNLRNLPFNWDSYGGLRIKETAILEAKKIIGICEIYDLEYPQVVPMSNGGVALEWHSQSSVLEIELVDRMNISYSMSINDSDQIVQGQINESSPEKRFQQHTGLWKVMSEGIRRRDGI